MAFNEGLNLYGFNSSNDYEYCNCPIFQVRNVSPKLLSDAGGIQSLLFILFMLMQTAGATPLVGLGRRK